MDQFVIKYLLGIISASLAAILIALLLIWNTGASSKKEILIAANTKTSDEYRAIQAIAKVVNQSSPNLQVKVVETAGSKENVDLLDQGLVDMSTMQGDYNAGLNTELISILYTDLFQFVKHKNDKIDDIDDLLNKKIGLSSESDGEYNSFQKVIQHFNLRTTDFELITGTWEAVSNEFRNKEVDVLFKVRFPTSHKLKELIKETNAEVVPIRQAAAICLQYPIYKELIIPKGSYSGAPALPETDIATIGIDRLLVCNSRLSNEVAYEICETILERRREISQHFEPLGFSRPPSDFSFIPLHNGTKNYLNKEEPNFWQLNSEPLALGLSVTAILVSFVLQLIASRKKQRVLKHNKNLIQLKFKIERASSMQQLEIYKDELSGFVARVVDDAVTGRISSAGFEFFSFTWESVQVILAEKEKKLEQKGR